MARRWAGLTLVTALGTMSAVSTARQPPPAAPIRLRATTFTPARGDAPDVPVNLASAQPRPGIQGDYIVQLRGPVLDDWKAALAAAGVELIEYVPDFAFRVRMRPDLAPQVGALSFVAWIGPYHPAYKLAPNLTGTGERPLLVRLERGADANTVEAALAATGTRVTRRGGSLLLVVAETARLDTIARMDGVASVEPFLLRVRHNEFGGGVIMGSRIANAAGFDGSSQTVAIADTGLGSGTAAGAHTGLPAARVRSIFNWPGVPDFCFDTIVNDGAADVDTGHGTHVATAALGSGNETGVGRGTAPEAGLVFQATENYAIPSLLCQLFYGLTPDYYLVGIPGDLGDLFQEAYDAGARVHSNSWGSDAAGAYTTDSENVDAFLWTHRDMAVAFSAGNAGVDGNADGAVDPTSIGSPASAKNVITVGASENDRQSRWECDTSLSYTACAAQGGQNSLFTWGGGWPMRYPVNPLKDDSSAGNAEQMAAFSSRGPTADGRIKPDVVAPGTWTLSGYSGLFQQQYDPAPNPQNNAYQYDGWGFPLDASYKYMGGTSMSAPLVAGGAAVVRDYYQKAHGHQASAALVKATLINSAADLLDENNDGLFDNANPIPNIHEGWGRVDLASATDGSHQFVDESTPLSTGGTAAFAVPVATPGTPLKITLVWTDYPSSTTAAVNLVNDLDLIVVGPDGTTYLGNRFAGGWAVAGGQPDRLNNVENVYLFAAAAGTWNVIVSGYNVPQGPQTFVLVVDNPQGSAGLPVVRALADDASASEVGPTGGVIRITRSGDTSTALTVSYTVSGTATAGEDYAALSGSVTIPEGAGDVVVPVEALDDGLVETTETVVVTLAPDGAYSVGSPSSAIVTIASDDLPPDLVVTTLTAPAYAVAGTTISVTDTTRNQGTTGAQASETGFYLSTNTALDTLDLFVGNRAVPPLPAGAADLATTTIDLPASTAPGTYYVVAKADRSGLVSETNEGNNVRASGAVRVGPDLIFTAVSAPATAEAGAPVLVSDTVKNQGLSGADESVTAFYLSPNATWDATDVFLGTRQVTGLAAGATDASSTWLTIPPSTAVGTYYILAKADANATVAEYAENNNVKASGSVKVGVDLTVSALAAPAATAPGETISVTETTKNVGAAAGPASITSFHLSSNTVLEATDTVLGSRPVPELAAGASDTTTVSLTIPLSTPAGTYYVLAKADGPSQVTETTESNNVKFSSSMKVGPDLTVQALTVPSTGGAGETLSVTDTVKNIGGAPTAATDSAFYISANTTFDASDLEIGRRPVSALAAGATDTATVPLGLPPGLATGTYYIISVVDPSNTVPELLESNNLRASSAVRVGPDLIVTALSGPSSAVGGATITVTDTTRNQGGGASASSVTRVYLSTNSAWDAADLPLGSRDVPTLGPGASSAGSTSVAIPAGTATGNYYLIARSDDSNLINETAETNNTRVISIRVN